MSYAVTNGGLLGFGLWGLGAFGTQPTIRQGSTGAPVKLWQAFLGVKADGIFGGGTATATKAFQLANGLTADGVVGAKSWAKADEVQAARDSAAPAGAQTTIQIPGMPPVTVPTAALNIPGLLPPSAVPVPATTAAPASAPMTAPPSSSAPASTAPASSSSPTQSSTSSAMPGGIAAWWKGQSTNTKAGIALGGVVVLAGLAMLFGSSPAPRSKPYSPSASTAGESMVKATPNRRRRRSKRRSPAQRAAFKKMLAGLAKYKRATRKSKPSRRGRSKRRSPAQRAAFKKMLAGLAKYKKATRRSKPSRRRRA